MRRNRGFSDGDRARCRKKVAGCSKLQRYETREIFAVTSPYTAMNVKADVA
jgi:hypothetical protein